MLLPAAALCLTLTVDANGSCESLPYGLYYACIDATLLPKFYSNQRVFDRVVPLRISYFWAAAQQVPPCSFRCTVIFNTNNSGSRARPASPNLA